MLLLAVQHSYSYLWKAIVDKIRYGFRYLKWRVDRTYVEPMVVHVR